MALSFNQSTVAAEPIQPGVTRQPLLGEAQGVGFRVDRLSIAAGGSHQVEIGAGALAWFQVLDGGAELVHEGRRQALSSAHVVFVPPRFSGTLNSAGGATVLVAQLPDALRHDPALANASLPMRIVDWTTEPVLLSEHDARKRIYLVTPKLFGTHAIKGEMIIYPPGTEAANHHHEGAAHFMYILAGKGICFANEQPFPVREGDIVYYGDGERHYLRSDPAQEMRFVEFFVPGDYKTVWAPGASVCTWRPAGGDIQGRKAAREIQAHSSAAPTPDI